MFSFKEYFLIKEAKFRKSKFNIHYKDFPMFSVFYEKNLPNKLGISNDEFRNQLDDNLSKLNTVLNKSRTEIGKMGFPSMHANIVFSDLTEITNPNTGGDVGGVAFISRRYMKIDYKGFIKYDDYSNLIVHEWAHLWMMSKPKAFKDSIEEIYQQIFKKDIPQNKLHQENFLKRRIHIRNTIKYYINDNVQNSAIQDLLNKGNSWQKETLIRIFKKTFSYCILNGLYQLGFNNEDTKEIIPPETEWIDNLVNEFVDSLIKTVSERENDRLQILNEPDDPNESYFYIFASWKLDYNILDILSKKIKELYLQNSDKITIYSPSSLAAGKEGAWFRDYIRQLINWYNSYGLSNTDEFWATAVEGFFKLPYNYRRVIIKSILNH